ELLKQRLDDLLSVLRTDALPAVHEDATLAEAAQWTEELVACVLTALADAHTELQALDLRAGGEEAQASELLRKDEYMRPEDLKQAVIRAAAERIAAERRYQTAVGQIELAD